MQWIRGQFFFRSLLTLHIRPHQPRTAPFGQQRLQVARPKFHLLAVGQQHSSTSVHGIRAGNLDQRKNYTIDIRGNFHKLSDDSDRASVTPELAVYREENEWLTYRLSNQQAIEGIAMVVAGRQGGKLEDVGVPDRQPSEAH